MHPFFLLAPLLLGISGGLRTFAPVATLLLAVHLEYLSLNGTWLTFLTGPLVLVVGVVLSLGELVGDKLSFAPDRTAWFGLAARILSGAFSGAVVMAAVAGNSTLAMTGGAIIAAFGALIGTFGGFYARRAIVRRFGLRDSLVATGEDLLTFAFAVCGVMLIA